jgi:hypothetical protein
MDVYSPSTACIVGGGFFLTGLLWIIIFEGFGYDESFTFILSHWLIFFWLINDIFFYRIIIYLNLFVEKHLYF